jgi:hypothetical protein
VTELSMTMIRGAVWADRVAAWITGLGIGLIAMMLAWLAGNRLSALVWSPPVGPTVAFVGAIVVGLAVAVWSAVRLDRGVRSSRPTVARDRAGAGG